MIYGGTLGNFESDIVGFIHGIWICEMDCNESKGCIIPKYH